MNKIGFTLFGCALLILLADPVWAQCGEESPPNCVAQQTFTLEPGVTVSLPVGNNLYKFKPLDNAGGELLTITAISILESDFDNVDPLPKSCVPVKDLTDAASGAHTCVEFQHDCAQGASLTDDCATFHYQLVFNYDLPSDLPAIGGPDWEIKHHVDCPLLTGEFDESIFVSYSVNKFDPRHAGGDTGPSCNAPEWTPGAPVITTATGFAGFDPPVSNTGLNTIKAGRTLPLKWLQLDRFGTPVTDLTLCTDPTGVTCGIPWVMIQSTPIVCPGNNASVTGGLTPLTGAFNNQGKGRYHFNWNTDPGSTGCVAVVLIFDLAGGPDRVVASPANFMFK
jgi:hypothetical protein